MVYVLCRIVGQLEPTHMINLQSADEPGRTNFVQQALAAFGSAGPSAQLPVAMAATRFVEKSAAALAGRSLG